MLKSILGKILSIIGHSYIFITVQKHATLYFMVYRLQVVAVLLVIWQLILQCTLSLYHCCLDRYLIYSTSKIVA